jgi:hypothetical protein
VGFLRACINGVTGDIFVFGSTNGQFDGQTKLGGSLSDGFVRK